MNLERDTDMDILYKPADIDLDMDMGMELDTALART
jgi:hypothetical protein